MIERASSIASLLLPEAVAPIIANSFIFSKFSIKFIILIPFYL